MASQDLLLNYLPILIFMSIACVISIAMILGSLLLGKQNPDSEKNSAYECGFDAFQDARNKFDVRFYLVCLLLRSPFCFHGLYPLEISAFLGSGRWSPF